jgi:hypothetical protein
VWQTFSLLDSSVLFTFVQHLAKEHPSQRAYFHANAATVHSGQVLAKRFFASDSVAHHIPTRNIVSPARFLLSYTHGVMPLAS